MTNITGDKICECANDLVGFLYGELSEKETRNFERHMRDCEDCKTEYAAFGRLHESIVSWRDESLGVSLPGAAALPMQAKRPSALAAIRAFLNLSPAWLKGAMAVASIVLCLLATLAVYHLIDKKPSLEVAANGKKYSQQEMDEQLAKLAKRQTAPPSSVPVAANERNQVSLQPDSQRNPAKRQLAKEVQSSRRPLSRQERQELAAELRLSSTRDDDDLYLIGDGINQP